MTNTDTTKPGAAARALSKVPAVTLVFWIIKIACTTLGETAGDFVSMSLKLGYLIGTAIFAVLFLVCVAAQIRAKAFHPFLYWITIIATTTLGTTIADFADRSLGIGYAGGSLLLLALLLASLAVWRAATGTVDVNAVTTPKAEGFYWVTIMFSQTLGTALGDWTSDSPSLGHFIRQALPGTLGALMGGGGDEEGLGYIGAAVLFGTLLAIILACVYFTKIPRTALFWAAFILTRPLGAVLGDFLDKPLDHGGLNLSRAAASGVLLAIVVICILVFPQRAGQHPGGPSQKVTS
ncbi:MAG: COG4705 family protein [Asticcacaulis sp.]